MSALTVRSIVGSSASALSRASSRLRGWRGKSRVKSRKREHSMNSHIGNCGAGLQPCVTAALKGCATAAILAAFAEPASAATKAIRAGKLIDPNGRTVTNATIVIEDDRIASV